MTKYNMNTNTAVSPLLLQCYDNNHITITLKRQQAALSSSSDCWLDWPMCAEENSLLFIREEVSWGHKTLLREIDSESGWRNRERMFWMKQKAKLQLSLRVWWVIHLDKYSRREMNRRVKEEEGKVQFRGGKYPVDFFRNTDTGFFLGQHIVEGTDPNEERSQNKNK